MFQAFLFYLFSLITIASAVGVVTVRNPVYAALFLILAFFNSAALWLLLEAEFLGITLVLVYVGAVMVLFLFVIMMLDVKTETLKEGLSNYLPAGLGVLFLVMSEMILVALSPQFSAVQVKSVQTPLPETLQGNTEHLGYVLYTEYLYPFEIAALILLVAIIAAILLTLRTRPDSKGQVIEQQVQVRPEDRVRLVNLKSEKS